MNNGIIEIDFLYNFQVEFNSKGLLKAQFVSKKKEATSVSHFPKELRPSINEIKNYFKGNQVNFKKIKIDLSNYTDFQKQVYLNLQSVPAGKTITYKDLAAKIQNPGAIRAVGTAMRKNNLPLIIPCHRVVKADGTLGRYSAIGGTKTKSLLLARERALDA